MTNPAGPGFTRPSSLEYYQTIVPSLYHRGPGDVGRGLFWSFPNYRFGLQFVSTEDGPGHGTLSFSNSRMLRPRLSFGTNFDYHYFPRTDPALPGAFSLRAGFAGHVSPVLAWGLVFDNLLSPDSPVDVLKSSARAGIALRPFGESFRISADVGVVLMDLLEVPRPSLLTTLSYQPVRGMMLDGALKIEDVTADELNYLASFGFTMHFGKFSVGDTLYAANSSGSGDYSGNTFLFAGHGNRVRSDLIRKSIGGQIWQVTIRGELNAPPSETFLGNRPDGFPLFFQSQRLHEAADHPKVRAVWLVIENNDASLSDLQELRAEVRRLQDHGKKVIAYLSTATAKDLYLASACDLVVLHPAGHVELLPPQSDRLYVAKLLERMGVKAEVVRSGPYKASPEGWIAESPSQETIEMKSWLLEDLFEQTRTGIAEGRKLPLEVLDSLFKARLLSPEEALAAKLVDDLAYPDESSRILEQVIGRALPLQRDDRAQLPRVTKWGPQYTVGLLYLGGMIQHSSGEEFPDKSLAGQMVSDTTVLRALKRYSLDDSVKAVVVRVVSPGGDAFASDQIRRALEVLNAKKPVIVSMGPVAASGAYLLSLPARVILAEPATLTGSIGVYQVKFNASSLLEKLGIHQALFTAQEPFSTLDSLSRPWSEDDRARVEKEVQQLDALFRERVATHRKLSIEEVNALAGGRVFTGRQALERHLVDRLGGLEDAIEAAKEEAGIKPGQVVTLKIWPRRSAREHLLDNIFSERDAKQMMGALLLHWGASLATSTDEAASHPPLSP